MNNLSSMNIFCWNIRGFNCKIKRRGFRKWLKQHKPIFGGLVETHVTQVKAPKIINGVFPGWRYDCNYEFSELGRIWLLWHPSVSVSVFHKSLQSLSCLVKLLFVSAELVVTLVYGSNHRRVRRQLWSDLIFLSTSPQIIERPWSVLGDLNQTLSADEDSNADHFTSTCGMRDFTQCVIDAGLQDLRFCGSSFPWSNNQGLGIIPKKLDRIMVNDKWLELFPNALGVFGEPGISDHSPCCVFLDAGKQKLKRPFKFSAMLNDHPDFEVLIAECWNSLRFAGSKMLCVSKKLKHLKSIIREFSRQNFSGIELRVSESFAHLQLYQRELLASPSTEAAIKERSAHSTWFSLAKAEESYLYQRSRVKWIDVGDSNSNYYHRSLRSRQAINQIIFLTDENGVIINSREVIQAHVVQFYHRLLGGTVTPSSVSRDEIAALLPFRCSPDVIQRLDAPYSAVEIRDAFFSLPKGKAPGPDGFPVEFYTAHWKSVGSDMINAVSEFFRSGCLLKQWNATVLTLIPKKINATAISDFRPISCCNTTYKVISTLLASRLKQVLPQLISNTQSAFIPGRLMVENVLMATELVSGYNWKNISKRSMLKVNLKKAFDSLEWNFIFLIMQALEFPESFISLIRQCFTTTRFSVAINGEMCGYFSGTKGLRQGDPLSPYLFVLAMEVLAQLLNANYRNGSIGYHPKASNPLISHFAFADDLMIFFDGEKDSLQHISATLDAFSSWSGLTMNHSKTELFIAGLNQVETDDISSLGFSLGSLPVLYLGLPLMHRKLRICDYRPLIDQLKRRFSSWTLRALSYAGRVVLISSVIYGTINFWFSSFILPKGCIKMIESLCSRFLWNGNINTRAAAKVSWSQLCLPRDEGGLGFRNLSIWNITLCLKLIWLLFSVSESLWAIWVKANHIKDSSFWCLDKDMLASWTWKALLKLRPLAEGSSDVTLGMAVRLASGMTTSPRWVL